MEYDASEKVGLNTIIEPNDIPTNHNVVLADEKTVERIPRQKSITMIIPCLARGVSDTHTPTNAYFAIPRDCKHGMILKCSNYKCRQSGRRFRYCEQCKKVSAMRNFSKRHSHLPICPAEMTSNADSVGSTNGKEELQPHVGSDGESLIHNMSADYVGGNDESSCSATAMASYLLTTSTSMSPTFDQKAAANSLKPMMVTQTEANLIRQIRSSQNNIEETIRGVESIFQVRDKKDEEDVLPDKRNEQEQLQL